MKLSQLSLADYNQLDSIPVINQDLSASGFTPVANTYYRHTGSTTDTFTQGVIYLYDTAYHKLGESGGGGISDVKVNGASVVTDGVANIPPASESANGVVTTGTQTFSGVKRFNSNVQIGQAGTFPNLSIIGGNLVIRSSSAVNDVSIYSYSGSNKFANIVTAGRTVDTEIRYILTGRGKSTSSESDYSHLDIQPYNENCIVRTHPTYGTSVAMFAPQSWSSGTSGSVTLSGSGLYEIKASVGSGVFSTILNWDGSSICYSSSLGIQDTDAQALSLWHYEVGSTGILSLYKVDSTGSSTIDTTANISYRKIGIA